MFLISSIKSRTKGQSNRAGPFSLYEELMTDRELIAAFEAGRVPEGGFHHVEHVRVAWNYLTEHPLATGLALFAAGLKRFAAAQGHPALYHETVTTAFVLLINERLDRARPGAWEGFAAAHPDLLAWKPSLLDRYYTPELLWSDRAKQTFVMPDRLSAIPG
jgi:hypothetical protein